MSSALECGEPAPFSDRRDAGRRLAQRLIAYADRHPVVVAVAPDGMPLAAEIAHALHAPLDTVAVEPLVAGDDGAERFGAAAEGGIALFDPQRRALAEARAELVDAALIATERRLEDRSQGWHDGDRRPSLHGRTVLLVSDILDDELLAAAAACAVRDRGAAAVICVAARVRLAAALAVLEWIDEIVCLEGRERVGTAPEVFGDSAPVSDEQVGWALRGNQSERQRVRGR